MSKIVDHKYTSLYNSAKSGQDDELTGTDSTEVIISSHDLTNVITFKWNRITKLRRKVRLIVAEILLLLI